MSGNLGSSPIDDFVRRSAGASGYSEYAPGIRPYYFERRTVTGIDPGTTQIYRPPVAKVSYGEPTGLLQPSLSESRIFRIPPITTTEARLRPLSMTTEEFEEALARDLEKYPQYVPPEKVTPMPREKLSEQEYEEQMDALRESIEHLKERTNELKQSLQVENKLEEKPEIPPLREEARKPLEIEEEEEKEEPGETDIFEEMDRQAEEFQKMVQERRIKAEEEAKKKAEETAKEKDGEEETKKPVLEEMSSTDLATRARGILGTYGTFEAFAAARYTEHMAQGDKLLKEGKYYRAADSYTMALLYKKNDARALAGKSYALFAAGEYMSSALFLSRALEAAPEYASEKIDIVAVIGDRDKIESRVADVEQWFKRSQAPELQFLLGYMYYRLDRLPQASEAIKTASEKMPESAAAATLKKAIEGGSN